MKCCERHWCPGTWSRRATRADYDGDGLYENRIFVDKGGIPLLVKQYRRQIRFSSEVAALRHLAQPGLTAQLLDVCWQHQATHMTRLDAKPLAQPLADSEIDVQIATHLGLCLQRLHASSAPAVGPFGRPSAKPWPAFLRQNLATRLLSLPLTTVDLSRLRAYLDIHLSMLDLDLAPRVLHHDLKPANILLHHDERLMLCDFDQARGGDPLSDLGKLWWRTFHARHSESWHAFLRAYRYPEPDPDKSITFYMIVHCIGALAYWHDHRLPRFRRHACSARELLALHTAVTCPVDGGESPVA